MESVQEHKDGSAIMLEGDLPGGAHVKASFRDRLSAQEWLIFLNMVLTSVLIYLVVSSDTDRERRYNGQTVAFTELISQGKSAQKDHEFIKQAIKDTSSEQRVQTYVLTLDDKGRKALNLQEPEELRARRR